MTIDEQLRAFARHADEHQAVITVDEIMRRAEHHDPNVVDLPGRPANKAHRGRRWLLLAAAVVVVVGAAGGGLLAVDDRDDEPETIRTVNDPPKPSVVIRKGFVAFAADPQGGDALTDPLTHFQADMRPAPRDIYVTLEGEPTRRITATAANERCPAFSPDGGQLAFLELPGTGGAGDGAVAVVPLDEDGAPAGAVRRTSLPTLPEYSLRRLPPVSCPEWSPDGTRVAYISQRGTESINPVFELHVWTIGGEDQVIAQTAQTPADSLTGSFAWSPDGKAIAYAAKGGASTAALDGGAPSVVLAVDETPVHPDAPTIPVQAVMAVAWSSRGELAVTVRTYELSEPRGVDTNSGDAIKGERFEAHIVDVATGRAQPVAGLGEPVPRIVWSPDGSRFAFPRDGQIQVHNRADGSTATLPLPPIDGGATFPRDVVWAPDGTRFLATVRNDDRGFALVSFSSDGTSAVLLTPWTWAFDMVDADDISWQPTLG